MENVLLTLVVVLLVMVLLMLAGVAILTWKLLRRGSGTLEAAPATSAAASESRYHPAIRQRLAEAQLAAAHQVSDSMCALHPQEPAEGSCAICDRAFCRVCLKPHRTLLFCREHLNTFLSAPWSEVHTVKSSTTDPEAGVRLVEWKKTQWHTQGIPLFLETHYKINVDGDMIESWVVLFAREVDREAVKERLERHDASPAALS